MEVVKVTGISVVFIVVRFSDTIAVVRDVSSVTEVVPVTVCDTASVTEVSVVFMGTVVTVKFC